MNDFSMFLFARPSFLEGMARALDLGGNLQEYNTSLDGEQADFLAHQADIRAVNADFGIAVRRAQEQDQMRDSVNHE